MGGVASRSQAASSADASASPHRWARGTRLVGATHVQHCGGSAPCGIPREMSHAHGPRGAQRAPHAQNLLEPGEISSEFISSEKNAHTETRPTAPHRPRAARERSAPRCPKRAPRASSLEVAKRASRGLEDILRGLLGHLGRGRLELQLLGATQLPPERAAVLLRLNAEGGVGRGE